MHDITVIHLHACDAIIPLLFACSYETLKTLPSSVSSIFICSLSSQAGQTTISRRKYRPGVAAQSVLRGGVQIYRNVSQSQGNIQFIYA